MKALCLVATLCWLVGLTSAVEDPTDEIYNTAVQSVVYVESEAEVEVVDIFHLLPPIHGKRKPGRLETRVSTGTGFAIGGNILTAYHVVEGTEKISITDIHGRKQEVKVIKFDKKSDLALLSLPKLIPSLVLGKLGPREKVWQIGHPGPMRFVTNEGRFEGFDGKQNVFDISSYFGNSGGPLLNRNGEVVGLVHAIKPGFHMTFGGTIEELSLFLKH